MKKFIFDRLFFSGDRPGNLDLFVLTRDDKAILDTLAKGQMVFALALGDH